MYVPCLCMYIRVFTFVASDWMGMRCVYVGMHMRKYVKNEENDCELIRVISKVQVCPSPMWINSPENQYRCPSTRVKKDSDRAISKPNLCQTDYSVSYFI